jgi:hypothetical protein
MEETIPTNKYGLVIKWCRRLSAAAVWILLIRWFRGAPAPASQVERLLYPVLDRLAPFPSDRAAVAIMTLWYAFLTQLKIRWALWLPFYFVLYPIWWGLWTGATIFWKTIALAAGPVVKQLESLNEIGIEGKKTQPAKARGAFPRKRVWLIALFVWLLVFRGLNTPWAAWLAPALAIPVCIFFLRMAYRFAIAPKSFATYIASTCTSLLENQSKTLRNAQEKKTKVQQATYVYGIVNAILSRYSETQLHTVVQREAMSIFALSLGAALLSSGWLWGLVAVALLRTDSHVLDAYAFFSNGNLTEGISWAWGCMTTAISFPGSQAAPWLKVLHGVILATGIFQLTFLLLCFSIMTNAETARVVRETADLL